jgi:type IV pilus assembly protein PilE
MQQLAMNHQYRFRSRTYATPQASSPHPGASAGFSLIELMIVVAIVAILAAIAYPSYQAHVRKSNRAAAEAFLMDIATRQQQYFLDTRSYAGSVSTLGMNTPTEVAQNYDDVVVTPSAGPPPGYTLQATPHGMQVHDSRCAPLKLDQGGTKLPSGCW